MMTPPGDGEGLSDRSWVWPDEHVVWTGRDRYRGYPWLRVCIGGLIVFASFVLPDLAAPDTSAPTAFLVIVGLVLLVAMIASARAVERHRKLDRYVLTTRRAVVVRGPNRLISQAGALTSDLRFRLDRSGLGGNADWGRSDLLTTTPRFLRQLQSFAWVLGLADPEQVRFDHVERLAPLVIAARQVRSPWGVETLDPDAHSARGSVPIPLGFLDSRTATVLNTVALSIGSALLVLGVILLALTFASGHALFGFGPVTILFVLIFPLFGWAIFVLLGRRQRPGEPFPMHSNSINAFRLPWLPRWLLVMGIAMSIGSWVIGARTIGNLPGQPSYNETTQQYTYDDHGEVVVISEPRYEDLVKEQNRLFLSGVVAFTTVSVGIACDEAIRQRRRLSR